MKNLTAMILAIAMLCAVSCKVNTTTPAETTATTTTVGSDAPIAPPETTETTAPVEDVDIPSLLEGYTLHELSSDELESFRAGFPEDSALGKLAVKVTDYDELYLLMEDEGVIDGDAYERAKVQRVICGDTVQDCNITFVFGPSGLGLLKTDEYTVVSHCWYFSYHYIFHKDGCVYIPADYGRDGASLWLSVEDGKLCYKLENPIITNTFGDYGKILDSVTSEDEWRYEWGTVSLDGDRVVLSKTKEQTMGDDNFLRDLFAYGSQFETLEELLEYNRNRLSE